MTKARVLTKHQKDVLLAVENGNDDDSPITASQIIEKIKYTATKQAFRFVLKFMLNRDLIQRDDGGFRITDRGRVIAKNYKKENLKDAIVETDTDF